MAMLVWTRHLLSVILRGSGHQFSAQGLMFAGNVIFNINPGKFVRVDSGQILG